MDIPSLLNHHFPTSPLSSPPTKSSTQEGDENIKPLILSETPTQAESPASPKSKPKPKPEFKSKSKTSPSSRSKSKSKSKPQPEPATSKKTPKKTKAKSSAPIDSKPHPWTTADKIALLNIVSSRGASIKNFEGAIEGRSGLACYIRWKHIILRGIKLSLLQEEKNEKKAGVKAVKAKEAKERYKRKAALKVKLECV